MRALAHVPDSSVSESVCCVAAFTLSLSPSSRPLAHPFSLVHMRAVTSDLPRSLAYPAVVIVVVSLRDQKPPLDSRVKLHLPSVCLWRRDAGRQAARRIDHGAEVRR